MENGLSAINKKICYNSGCRLQFNIRPREVDTLKCSNFTAFETYQNCNLLLKIEEESSFNMLYHFCCLQIPRYMITYMTRTTRKQILDAELEKYFRSRKNKSLIECKNYWWRNQNKLKSCSLKQFLCILFEDWRLKQKIYRYFIF